jgi:hypothetical protein
MLSNLALKITAISKSAAPIAKEIPKPNVSMSIVWMFWILVIEAFLELGCWNLKPFFKCT